MEQCCICKKKIWAPEPPIDQLSSDLPEYTICFDCRRAKNQILQQDSSSTKIAEGKEYFKKFLKSSELQPQVYQYVSDLVTQTPELFVAKRITKLTDEQIAQLERDAEEERKRIEGINERRGKRRPPIMITTGYDFQGYEIIEYKGIVSGDVVLGTGFLAEFDASFSDFFGEESSFFAEKLRTAKQAALENLKNEVFYTYGTNAAVGLAFAYPAFRNNMIGISATATAVVLQRKEILIELERK